jgi:RHS repeat-associated protein
VSPYSYNTSNELTSTPSATYTYDNNGNTATKVDSSGTTTYNWDSENRLESVVLPASGGTVTFRYDPFGRRVQKSGPAGTTDYLYEDFSRAAPIIEEVDNGGVIRAKYTGAVSSAIAPAIDEPLAMVRLGATSYYQADGLKSIGSISSASGGLNNTYSYDSFGNLKASSGTLLNPFEYTGREFDAESGEHCYRTRYYDASIGRFLSEDLIRFKGGTNFYSYVKNRPLMFVDPMGTCSLQILTSPNAYISTCSLIPNTDTRCQCICQIGGGDEGFQACVKDCKDGCLSRKLDPAAACQCLCDKARDAGTINGFEAWLCKRMCKGNSK